RVDTTAEVIGTLEPVADDHVDLVGGRQEATDLGEIELAVTVGEEDPPELRGFVAGAERGAVALVLCVVNDAYLAVPFREVVRDRGGVVAAAVVDDDHLEAVEVVPAQDGERLVDGALDVGLLVEAREEDAQLTDTHRDPASV